MIARAYAKINLNLRVLDKRPDGYHNIESIMQTISLHDTLDIELTDSVGEIDLSVEMVRPEQEIVVAGPGNLCYRAAKQFLDSTSSEQGVTVKLKKLIPSKAGLGGGSSDAATTLLTLNKLVGNPLDLQELTAIAKRLGADVPFFLTGGTCRVTGIGEVVEPIDEIKPIRLLVIKPDCSVSTPEAYSAIDKKRSNGQMDWPHSVPTKLFDNDFEAVVYQHYLISEAHYDLLSAGCNHAMLCGSGSAVVGFFEDDNVDKSRERMQTAYRLFEKSIADGSFNCQAFPCRTVSRAQLTDNKEVEI